MAKLSSALIPGAAMLRELAMINENNRLRLPVTLTMNDGKELYGDLIVNIGGTLDRTLNNETLFVLFGDPDGSERMIAKSGILEVVAHKRARDGSVQVQSSKTQQPTSTVQAAPSQPMDAYEVLGLPSSASESDIQNAFVEKVSAYHPDRFQSANLPADVAEYVESMSRRINDAYKELMKDKAPALTTQMMPPVAQAS